MSSYTGGPITPQPGESGLPEGGEFGDLLVIDSVTGEPVWDDTPLLQGESAAPRFTIANTGTGPALLLIGAGASLATLQITSQGRAITASGGDIEAVTVGTGFILKSPDGTRYRITVANGGALSAVAV